VAFDAELHLRLTGERTLLDGGEQNRGPWPSAVLEAARALVAVGAIEAGIAQAVVDDYALATAMRQEGRLDHWLMRRQHRSGRGAAASSLQPRRVIACNRVLERPSGAIRVRSVSLAADGTSVSVKLPAGFATRGRRVGIRMAMGPGVGPGSGPPQLTFADDRGTTATAHFSGGGSDAGWSGRFTTVAPLAQDTAWIEIDGERIELTAEPQSFDVRVEQLPDENPALRYLWQRAASGHHFHGPHEHVDVAVEALVAAGAIDAGDPALDDLDAVLDVVRGHGRMGPSRRLPEPWRSLTAGGPRGKAPSGELTIGAVTPELDGIAVAVTTLESSDDGFELDVEASPDPMITPFDSEVEKPALSWWAADDRGNHYLGRMGSWGGGDVGSGTIAFWPPLDGDATRLDLMPTARTARAVIEVPLRWSEP
jgi:hypothetical protein